MEDRGRGGGDTSEQAFPAVGTPTQVPGQEFEEPLTVLGVRLGDRLRLTESVPAAREELGQGSVGQKAVVTHPDKALGEDVEEEAATELTERERLGPWAARAVVFVTEGDGRVVDMLEPVVGDRNAVGVASKIPQDVLGVVEGRLGATPIQWTGE